MNIKKITILSQNRIKLQFALSKQEYSDLHQSHVDVINLVPDYAVDYSASRSPFANTLNNTYNVVYGIQKYKPTLKIKFASFNDLRTFVDQYPLSIVNDAHGCPGNIDYYIAVVHSFLKTIDLTEIPKYGEFLYDVQLNWDSIYHFVFKNDIYKYSKMKQLISEGNMLTLYRFRPYATQSDRMMLMLLLNQYINASDVTTLTSSIMYRDEILRNLTMDLYKLKPNRGVAMVMQAIDQLR